MKRKFQQCIRDQLCPSADPDPPTPSEDDLHSAISHAEQTLLLGNPECDKPWFVQSIDTLAPLCDVQNKALLLAHDVPTEFNKCAFRKAKSTLASAVRTAKSDWARNLAYDCMQYKAGPI
eukprot:15094012-Ditylum_brightwellii.AAC.1